MKRGIVHSETHSTGTGKLLRDFILGGQDGLVNVLGLILGVATATQDPKFVIIAGLSALFAESISMGAVAYTSSKAQWDYYRSERTREVYEIKKMPDEEKKEIRQIYHRKGFRGKLLDDIVKKITSNKKLWLETMMVEELRLFPDDYQNPGKIGGVVFVATVIGSVIPLMPFFFLPVFQAAVVAVCLAAVALFIGGYFKAKVTMGKWFRSGMEMVVIGVLAAVAGYIIGELLQVLV